MQIIIGAKIVPKSIPKRDIDFIGESLVETINKNYLTMEDIMTDKFTKPILRNLRISLQDILKAESKQSQLKKLTMYFNN